MTSVINIKGENPETIKALIEKGEVVYIGKAMGWGWGLKQSPWRNRYKIGRDGTRDEVLIKYKSDILNNTELLKRLPELKGKKLACWCKPLACHGDVLVELIKHKIANSV